MKKVILFLFSTLILSAAVLGQTEIKNDQNSTYSDSSAFKPVRKIEPYEPQKRKSDKKKSKKKEENEGNEKKSDANQPTEIIFPVSVFDQNADYIKGLNKQDFKVFENGIEQKTEFFESGSNSLTVILILDTSPSSVLDIKRIRDLAEKFVEQLKPENKVVIAELNEQFRIFNEPINDRDELQKVIKKVKFGDGTSIYDGIAAISQKMNLIEGQKVIVFFTDGVDTTSMKTDYLNSLRFAEESNTAIFPLYFDSYSKAKKLTGNVRVRPNIFGNSPILGSILPNFPMSKATGSLQEEYELGEQYLRELAAFTGGRVIKSENDEKGLEESFSRTAQEIQNLYFIGYRPQVAENPVRTIKVRINRPNLNVLARENYFFGQN